VTKLDWDARLSLDMIRNHTKTDDVPGVTDDQLRLYRQAAVEAAEFYSGLMLSCQKTVTESIAGPRHPRPGKVTYRHRLQYPVANGIVYLYGGNSPNDNKMFRVPTGTRTIQVPIRSDYYDVSNCCDPCSTWNLNGGMMASYLAGFKSPDEVPAGIVFGCLQYLAWVVEHPGDELMGQRGAISTSGGGAGGIIGSNNVPMISGALETWRQFDPEAI
jgi:hypothetical protein